MPSTLSINNVNGTRNNIMAINNTGNPLNLMQYGDSNIGNQISNDPAVSSSVVPFPYISVCFMVYDLNLG